MNTGGILKKIEIIIKPFRLDNLREALEEELDISGMTVTGVRGCGNNPPTAVVYRGLEVDTDLRPKLKIELVVPDTQANEYIEVIIRAIKTGGTDDGKIFVMDVLEAVRIRTEQTGENAIK